MEFNKHNTISSVIIFFTTLIFLLFLSKLPRYKQWSFDHQYILNLFDSSKQLQNATSLSSINTSEILLIYVYANVHVHAYGNLKYFIETAVRENDGVDYVFILQQTENKPIDETKLPRLPQKNAFYFQHENKCFDYGTMGWFFDQFTIGNPWQPSTSITEHVNRSNNSNAVFNLKQYKYFIFMNSSIRGPFFPPYFLKFASDYQMEYHKPFYWYTIFIRRLNDKVKLVGGTISCIPVPHVQSYLLVTDSIGFSILLKSSTANTGRIYAGVFGCYPSKSDTTTISELGISKLILDSGYMMSSLMSKHQMINFSKNVTYNCQVYANPYSDKSVDGSSLEPYDVVFVKFNAKKTTTDAQDRAMLYQRWMEETTAKNRTLR
ncbi:unnamed protein product [Adineta ricciae]|uniref:Uncharacterized protein n=1 Tax=Adineta ricciae TaxID=249248 RepID=A0A815UH61_ADIRI|nr:unnamed protein product [Adineta ricciae]CAF1577629.1 unnamed protein product [Adineta ricciae]